MISDQERAKWKSPREEVDATVDEMVRVVQAGEFDPVAYMAIDMIFRSFFHWIHMAQVNDQNPETTRDAALQIVDLIIIECSKRMGSRNSNGERIPKDVWIGEFMLDLQHELVSDLDFIQETQGSC
jgi:hypothetical protein